MITIEELDRTIYEHIRQALVSKGYLPDVTEFNTETEYSSAKKQLKTLIEVFGVGTSSSRDKKHSHSIIIDRKTMVNGTLGGYPATKFEEYKNEAGDTKFKKIALPEMSYTIAYEIRHITNTIKMDRVLTSIILGALRHRASIPVIDIGTDQFKTDTFVLSRFNGNSNVGGTDWHETVYSYLYPDVWLKEEDAVILDNIPPMTSVDFGVYLVKSNTSIPVTDKDIDVEIKLNTDE